MVKKKTPSPSGPQQTTMTIDQAINAAYGHWQAGQLAEAEHLCQKILQAVPSQPHTLHLMGLMAHTRGNLVLAIEFVSHACQSPQADAMFFSNLAEMYRQAGDLARGEVAGRRAVELAPNQPDCWSNLGIILQESGKFDESLTCLLNADRIAPQNPKTHNNIANTYMRLGRHEDARNHYTRATELAPEYAEAYNNLSFLLKETGDFDAALEAVNRAIEINPRYMDAYINAAGIAIGRGNGAQAQMWLDNLASFAPEHPATLLTRAKIMHLTGRHAEAEISARETLQKSPQSGEACQVYADILKSLGRTDEARAHYDKALSRPNPNPVQALLGKAVLLMETGDREGARALIEQAYQQGGRLADTLLTYSQITTFTADDPMIGKIAAMLTATGNDAPTPTEAMTLHFVLGKAFLDSGDPEKAFQHFAAGNKAKRQTLSYDSDQTLNWLASIAQTFTPDLMKTFSGGGNPSDAPIFIVGMPRSGTTLVEQILASHPMVHGGGELDTLLGLVQHIAAKPEINASFPDFMAQLPPQILTEASHAYLQVIRDKAQHTPHLVDKMPANFLHVGLINLMFPNAKIIHCRRDPVDTCLSCYTSLFGAPQKFSYDLAELGAFYNGYNALMEHWHDLLPADRLAVVDYETLVEDQEGETRKLLDFLGLGWDEACLDFHKTERPISTLSFAQVREPIYRTSVKRWQKYRPYLQPLTNALYPDGVPEE
ncbi:tetratricopeptide repeat-containing sulfotransferase family protein [Sneathiella chinensis]|uniref:Sulfotransferase n=1 Tax=Sneathiella chinensis TaxID=349750 RepID=A0ABQ5U6R0_9PROT|nr:tetratricopeptide repeat-containing sulfotransferase family protein [Sneathiella chinensis]GLQ06850.1 sulfotransferase [Sneathiella chinensis]